MASSSSDTPDDSAPAPAIADSRARDGPINDAPPNTRRCFVCLVDEPEETLPADWSTPCKCSIQGHQDCLLTWVADLESQAKAVKCPVCQSAIVVTERWDAAVQLDNFLNRNFTRWSPRILLGFLASGAVFSSSIYGAKAIEWFAGPDAALAFLFKTESTSRWQILRRTDLQRSDRTNFVHFGVLPLIAPALILNRIYIGEVVLVPVSLLYAMLFDNTADFLSWPPSPERVLTLYPAIRATYFQLHRALSSRLEKTWASRAQSHAINGDVGTGVHLHDEAPPQDAGGNLLDFEIDIQIGGDENPRPGQPGRVLETNARSPTNLIAGALLWPGVCYGMGELLRTVLPSRIVTRTSLSPTGLLQERWGRSLVGGCLFVVLKDAFFLYMKYRRTMNRPYRRIKNSEQRNLQD